jgi:hypothetical protein
VVWSGDPSTAASSRLELTLRGNASQPPPPSHPPPDRTHAPPQLHHAHAHRIAHVRSVGACPGLLPSDTWMHSCCHGCQLARVNSP